MTFSILARDDSGAFGMAVTSSSPAVAARCLHLRGGVGGVASQNITDPRYGPRLLDALAAGGGAAKALDELMTADPTAPYRQVSVVDDHGNTAVHSGEHTLGRYAAVESTGAVTAGNLLADETIPRQMMDAYHSAEGEFEHRLLAAMFAGEAAGGEQGDLASCGLAVARRSGWNETDLRIDAHQQPLQELQRLLRLWLPERDDYVTRGIEPHRAPAYGVPGDP